MVTLLLLLLQSPADAILGRWEGVSTCTTPAQFRNCHDEIRRDDFVRDSTRPGVIIQHAYNRINGEWNAMGDLELKYDSTTHRWVGEWSNGRVRVQWSYWLEGTELAAEMIDFPAGRKGREARFHRPAPATR
jgi:hypothetical protein